MKIRHLLAFAAALFLFAGVSQAGWHGGGWGCGPRVGFGWGGGYCGPRWGGWGWGGPAFGITVAAPVPVYRPVYVAQPAAYYVTTTTYRTVAPSSKLVRAQSQLANLGYYRGTVDGAFGPLTCRALAQYQADYGLPVTGRLDRATLKSLGV